MQALLWTSTEFSPSSCERESGSLQVKTGGADSRLPCRGERHKQRCFFGVLSAFHLLNALSCPNTAAVSSPHGNLMQECQESVAIDWNLNGVMYKWLMFLLTCQVGGWTGHGCLACWHNSFVAYLNVSLRQNWGVWTSYLRVENSKITGRYVVFARNISKLKQFWGV